MRDLIANYSEIGVALKGARVKEGVTQAAVARKLGFPRSTLARMENGSRAIGAEEARRLSKILRISRRVFL